MSAALRERAEAAAAAVVDPELPFLTIAELGILRGVTVREDGAAEVAITPTYTGCVATAAIAADVATALERAGITGARVRTVLAPAWTTDWLSEAARHKLLAAGIAPPGFVVRDGLFEAAHVACPHCGSESTERLSAFGSTPCKAVYRCLACREPFEAFKCL